MSLRPVLLCIVVVDLLLIAGGQKVSLDRRRSRASIRKMGRKAEDYFKIRS